MEKVYHANMNQKKAGVALFTSGRVDYKAMKIIKNT